ncbi:MAG: DUF2769 domain-containing protein [Erysipelotrichaceae bacterium]
MKQVERTTEHLLQCKCKVCPSYTTTCKLKGMPGNTLLLLGKNRDAVHAETLFCAYEKSECITSEHGCKCYECKVFASHELEKGYFCLETGGK